ncbi:flagellin [Selenomonas ruminantium]|uniref:flagellin N-terminal helical domain-containing protein n=1 Tax=Selenomonas ruminantium TaxID=971 RepID=UPI0026F2DEC6|nr:flagellin [Selenomonas ruminantium]
MAMVINNNSSAQMALGEMRKNNSKLDKASRQAANGVKIGGAGDGASEYSISEKMRVQIRGLEQDIANAQTGTSLIKTAEGGIQDIIDNLRSLKELALNAANDHNTDLDRETIQKEVNSRLETIDDIAATTNYNGRLLLNGDYGMPENSITNTTLPSEPTGTAIILPNGDYTISNDGVYMLPTGYQGRITITATNVKIVQQNPSDVHYATAIECSSSGGQNLWLDDVKIHNGLYAAGFYDLSGQLNNNVIKFNGSGNTLNIRNDVQLIGGNTPQGNDSENNVCRYYAAINTAGGLAINGVGNNSSLISYLDDNGGGYNCEAAAIGSDRGQQLSGDITINGLSYLEANSEWGPGIGAGRNGRVGNITINNVDEIRVGTRGGAGIGAAPSGQTGNININANRLYGHTGNYDGPGTVIGNYQGANGSININAEYIFLACKPATASLGNYTTGNNTSGLTITSPATVNGTPFNPNGNSYIANPSQYVNSQVFEYNGPSGANTSETGKVELHGLVIHTGTKANQNLRVIINSMDTGTLGIEPLPVNPRDAAVTAISAIDTAITYSLNENTRMGAYQTELSYTIANLTTASENTQSSESVIRDADMAKAMMEHAKYNILSQSSQAMLAQANQNSSGVLSLLQ